MKREITLTITLCLMLWSSIAMADGIKKYVKYPTPTVGELEGCYLTPEQMLPICFTMELPMSYKNTNNAVAIRTVLTDGNK